jgi:hypothetical protein
MVKYMTITKNPKPKASTEKAINNFINQAPDGNKVKRIRKGKKIQISITIDEEIIDQVDTRAKQRGQSRTGFICLAVAQALEKGFHLE